jgi:hypothetical protein
LVLVSITIEHFLVLPIDKENLVLVAINIERFGIVSITIEHFCVLPVDNRAFRYGRNNY